MVRKGLALEENAVSEWILRSFLASFGVVEISMLEYCVKDITMVRKT